MMEQDKFHEIYRSSLLAHFADVRQISHEHEGYGCYLSGAGPTVMILAPAKATAIITQKLQALDQTAKIEVFQVDREGVQVF